MVKITTFLASLYDKLFDLLHKNSSLKTMSSLVLLSFFAGIFYTFFTDKQVLFINKHSTFFGIELAFNVLLILEILGLIFIFADSVADSVGKQFEIISLILLRDSFKEFGHLSEILVWDMKIMNDLLPVFVDAIGAVFLFFITGVFYKSQKHSRITSNNQELIEFKNVKKIVALLIFGLFFYLGFSDIITSFETNRIHNSFNKFFTILVFTDIFILLYSLRFTTRFINVFRYSSFALTTVILRMTLTAPVYINVILCITASLFALLVTIVYNYLYKNEDSNLKNENQ